MKKIYTLLAGVALTFVSASAMAQSITTPDTVTAYLTTYVDAHAVITNTTGHALKIDWKVVAHNLPADWLTSGSVGICDNVTCYDFAAVWPTTTNTSNPYGPGPSGDIKVQVGNAATATLGCYYLKVRMNPLGSPNDSALTTFIICKTPVSVANVKAVDEVNLYPNPANNELNVVYDAAADIKSVGVYNIIGKLITVYKVSGNSANLNIENIPSGIYFVRLLNGQGQIVSTRKFTKQ